VLQVLRTDLQCYYFLKGLETNGSQCAEQIAEALISPMSRLRLQGFYLWRHVLSTASPFISGSWKFRKTMCPPPPQLLLHIGWLLCRPIFQKGTQSVYITERTRKVVYCICLICLWAVLESSVAPPSFWNL
jgi:hypothetical protein